ncbi:MAG: hypothetical protein IRZ33_05095 [Alicyclobacillaceae bacterium]|nr:hypothetical protein [Alicyclobacillaceae bacterium]
MPDFLHGFASNGIADGLAQRVDSCLREYGVAVHRWVATSPLHVYVSGPRGWYEGRFAQASSAVRRMLVGDHAARRGFRRTQRFLLTFHHERMVPTGNGWVFYLTRAWAGRPLEVTPADVADATDNLVQLHRALDGVADLIRAAGSPMPPRADWAEAFRRGRDAFAAERALLGQSASGSAVADWLGRWAEAAEAACTALHAAGYRDWLRNGGTGAVAWGDYRLAHLRRTRNGRLATLQVGDPVADDPLLDLACLCAEIVQEGHAAGVPETVARYRTQRGISPEAEEFVWAFAAYPHAPLRWLRRCRAEGRPLTADQVDWRRAENAWRGAVDLLKRNPSR